METHFYDSLDQYHKEKHLANLEKLKELRKKNPPRSGMEWMVKINAICGADRIAARKKVIRELDNLRLEMSK